MSMLEPYNKLIFKKKKLFLKLIQWKIGACVVNILATTQLATIFSNQTLSNIYRDL